MAYSPQPHHFLNAVPCLDFANTVVWRSEPARREDRLRTGSDLALWAKTAKLPTPRLRINKALELRETIDAYFRSRTRWPELVARYADALAEPDARFSRALLHSALELAFSQSAQRVKVCGNCGWLFLDRTRNGSKRWCIPDVCGSRTRSRRYYRRKTRSR
ncbi:MAG: CGNR zinc finger domain-containing protein [Hyphomicrobiales bacterium]